MKPFADLTPDDFRKHSVWEFCNDLESKFDDEIIVRPMINLPVADLSSCVASTTLRFANEDSVDGVLSNIDLNDHTRTEHFVVLTLYRDDGNMFHLARHHDCNIGTHGLNECAAFFGLDIAEVFPIVYDIDSVAVGVPASIHCNIPAQPIRRRLDREELMRMAVSG